MTLFGARRDVLVEMERRWMKYNRQSKPDKLEREIEEQRYTCFVRNLVPIVIGKNIGSGNINAEVVRRVAFDCIGLPVTYRKERLGFLRPIGPDSSSFDDLTLADVLDTSTTDFRTRCRSTLEEIYEDKRARVLIGRKRMLFAELVALPPLERYGVPGVYPQELHWVRELRRMEHLDLGSEQLPELLRDWVGMVITNPDSEHSHLTVSRAEEYLLKRLRGAYPQRSRAAMQAADDVLDGLATVELATMDEQ